MKKYFLSVLVLIICFGSVFADYGNLQFEPPEDDNLLSELYVENAPELVPVVKETPKVSENYVDFVDYKTVENKKISSSERTVFNFYDNTSRPSDSTSVVSDSDVEEIVTPKDEYQDIEYEKAEDFEEIETTSSDTSATDIIKAKRVPKGKFLLGAGVGYDFFNGEYESKDGSKFEIKTNFISLRVDAAYNINEKLSAYANFAFGFPGSLDWEGRTLDKKNHLAWNNSVIAVDKETATTGMRSIGVNAGLLYKFDIKGFDLFAGVGFHFDDLARDEEHKDTTGTNLKREYTFSNYGLNLHFEGRFDISNSWLVAVRFTPSFIFSGNFDEKRFESSVQKYSESKSSSKVRFNIGASVGAMYKF